MGGSFDDLLTNAENGGLEGLEDLLVDPSELKMKGPSSKAKPKGKPGKLSATPKQLKKNMRHKNESGSFRTHRMNSPKKAHTLQQNDFASILFTKLPPNYKLYKNKFLDLGVDYDLARHITHETLQSMGVQNPLERMKILKQISVVLRERPQVIHPSKIVPMSPISPLSPATSRVPRFRGAGAFSTTQSVSGYNPHRSRNMPKPDRPAFRGAEFSTNQTVPNNNNSRHHNPTRIPYSRTRGPSVKSRQAGMSFFEDTGSITSPQMRYKFKGEDFNQAMRSTRAFTARRGSEAGSMRSFKRDPSPSLKSHRPNIIRVQTEPDMDVFNLSWRIDEAQLNELHYGSKIQSNPMRLLLGSQTINCYLSFLLGYKEDTIHSLQLCIEFSDLPEYLGNVSVNVHNVQTRGMILQTETKSISGKTMDIFFLSSYDAVFRPMIHALNQHGLEFQCSIKLFMEDSQAMTNIEKDRDSQILRQMFDDRSLSDCRLTCESRTWHLHKCVLASQSESFRRHFQQKDVRELSMKADPALVDELVHWIYLGRVRHQERIRDLLQLAYKYEVKGLLEDILTILASRNTSSAGFSLHHRDISSRIEALKNNPNPSISKYEPIYQLFR